MRSLLIIGAVIVLTSCNLTERKNTKITSKDSVISQTNTTVSSTSKSKNSPYTDMYDSLARAYVDTSTLQGKRSWLMNQFLIENGLVSPDYDTLFDLTYDGFQDYVIGYYGKSGTGLKNSVKVYIFNPKKHYYILDEQLSDLPNPTFYIKKRKITGFYIGNGGGGGRRLEWITNKWTMTKEFEVDKEGDSAKWTISYPLKNKKEVIRRPIQMIPPEEILETDPKL
ncbi:hypothetical protein QNI16_31360 [Cytophagaceae bacterium YF14B1]|uniref:Lipoprotein n=1 Tax=Xanthocytophaga flava TaxID=3048013 RepID=A0AAE3QX55_9BACT|nr:hypothetical protein [Xanthocytophaga flavus]MDJ1485038.1 hypothetical protein [Xanthocytophaga flavus]